MSDQVSVSESQMAARVEHATPEQLVVLLLEGAQRFLSQVVVGIETGDVALKARMVNRVVAIIDELAVRLDTEGGTELAMNLARLYEWWSHELMEAASANEAGRVRHIGAQMEEIRAGWAEFQPAASA